MTTEEQHHGAHDESYIHIVPLPILGGVLALLLILTVATVGATWFDLGALNIWIAMLIATVKAVFVLLFFMHLKYDRPINAIIFVTALLFVFLFVGIVLMDTMAYQSQLIPGYAPALQR